LPGTLEELSSRLQSGFGQGIEPAVVLDTVEVTVAPRSLTQVMTYAKTELGFDLCNTITAVDDGDTFQVVYHLASVRPKGDSAGSIDPAYPGYLTVRVHVDKEEPTAEFEPEIPSITAIYPGANQ